jgi:hypothetical protein
MREREKFGKLITKIGKKKTNTEPHGAHGNRMVKRTNRRENEERRIKEELLQYHLQG